MKVLAIVGRDNLVVDEIPSQVNVMSHDKRSILLKRYPLFNVLEKGECSERWRAFAGREFDIELNNGDIEHAYGQWWDLMSDEHRDMLGEDNIHPPFTRIGVATFEELMNCYVFTVYRISARDYNDLLKSYHGDKYAHYEFENRFIFPEKRKRKERANRDFNEHIILSGFREVRKGVFESVDGIRIKRTDINYDTIGSWMDLDNADIDLNIKDMIRRLSNDDVRWLYRMSDGKIFVAREGCLNFWIWKR